jgi:glycosyltransferase involved in cell wall biosynthesis
MVMELAEGLRAKGYSLEIITSFWNNGVFIDRLRKSGFSMHILRIGFISATLSLDCMRMTAVQVWHWPALLWRYGRFLRVFSPGKIIHTNWHHLLLVWPFLSPSRDLFWLHEVVPSKSQYRFVFQLLERRVQCFVAVSQAVACSLADLGIAAEKIIVVHNGLADPCPRVGETAPSCERLRIGIVGQVGPWKGHDDLLDAFALITTAHPTAELHIIGRGIDQYERALKSRAAVLGITDRIVWRGHVSDRREIYRGLHLCVVPSRSKDPLPTTAIEAGFFGLSVVATKRGGLPEIVEDGVTGFLVEAEAPYQLATRMGELLSNCELRRSMGAAARLRAVTFFGGNRFVEDFIRRLD